MKKALLLFPILVFVLYNTASGQNQLIRNYHDNDSTLINEWYYVLPSDTSVKDSLYAAYSKEGQLLEKGFYDKGEKLGEWIRFFPSRQIESYGYYDGNNQFTGCRLFYQPGGKIEQIEYYKEGIAYNDSLELQQEFVLNIGNALRMDGFDKYGPMQPKYNLFQVSLARYDSITDKSEKLLFGNTIICDSYFLKGWFPYFRVERDSLLQLKTELDSFTVEVDPSFFKMQIGPLKAQTDSLLASDSIRYVLNKGPMLRTKFKQIAGDLEELERIKAEIVKWQYELESAYQDSFPVFYQSEIEKFNISYIEYKTEGGLQEKIEKGVELIELLAAMKEQFRDLAELKVSIEEKRKKLKTYKEKYPSVYAVEEQAINKEYNSFAASTVLKEKIELGNAVLSHIKNTTYNFYSVDSMEIVMTETYKPLRDNYLQWYTRIHAKEIKPISAAIAGFNRMNNLEQKKQAGQNILDTIRYFRLTYLRLQGIDTALNERYSLVESNFKENYRKIYKTEFAQLDADIKRYHNNNLSRSKLDAGNLIMDKISVLQDNYSNIEILRKEIDTRYPVISKKFENEFSPIYKNTIKLYDSKKAIYENVVTCKLYLEKGEDFLREVEMLEHQYKEINLQNAAIYSNLGKVESLYRLTFPEIFDKEIKDEKTKIKEYGNEGFIDKKLQTGELILAKLTLMQEAFPKLNEENTKIVNEFPGLIKDYKENFPALYKAYIIPLMDDEKTYRQSGYHAPKLINSHKIVEKIDGYRSQYDVFSEQNNLLLTRYNEFIYNYKDHNPVKRMYKKGKWAYDELRKTYDNEIDFGKKEEQGKLIGLVMLQFISLAPKDNAIRNDEFKKAKTVDDVLEILGIDKNII